MMQVKAGVRSREGCGAISSLHLGILDEITDRLFTQAIELHNAKEPQFMPYQNISAKLTDTDLQDIKTALATIEAKMPFLIHLTIEERRKLFKMGNKSLAFVSNSLTAAQSNPDILPASFKLDEFSSDYELAATLTEVHFRLQQITEKVDDTLMAVSSEAMSSSLAVYDYVKAAAKHTPGLRSIAEQLSERFKASRAKAPKEAPPSASVA